LCFRRLNSFKRNYARITVALTNNLPEIIGDHRFEVSPFEFA
jgi:hypothetical protein